MSKNPGYYQNSYLATPPVGSIMEYLGTNDPDGWIICNGTARTNNQDGRYNALNSLGIGSGGSGTSNYTPPNLQNQFTIGASSTYPLNSTGGNATKSLSLTEIPSHTHGMNHNHYVNFIGNTNGTLNWLVTYIASNSGTFTYTATNVGIPTSKSLAYYTGTVAGSFPDYNVGKPNTDTTGSGTAFTILPPSIALNYIIKY